MSHDASSLCPLTMNTIFPSVFEACHKIVDYRPFVEACEFDVCHMHINHIGCTSLETYADACAESGVCIDWRSVTKGLCGMKQECVMLMSSTIAHCNSQLTNNITAITSTKNMLFMLSSSLNRI